MKKNSTIEKCSELVSNLKTMGLKSDLNDVQEGANGIFESIANSLMVFYQFILIKEKINNIFI